MELRLTGGVICSSQDLGFAFLSQMTEQRGREERKGQPSRRPLPFVLYSCWTDHRDHERVE